MYAACVALFSNGITPPFGYSGIEGAIQTWEQIWLIAFTTLQIILATLVVIAIRKRLETLRSNRRSVIYLRRFAAVLAKGRVLA
jgi:hypothetical protein